MGFPLEGNQSLRVTGRLRARFFLLYGIQIIRIICICQKKAVILQRKIDFYDKTLFTLPHGRHDPSVE